MDSSAHLKIDNVVLGHDCMQQVAHEDVLPWAQVKCRHHAVAIPPPARIEPAPKHIPLGSSSGLLSLQQRSPIA